jgi:magnesium-transporting ATPase (P-type)
MATFHRMKDESGNEEIRCFVKGAPEQAPSAWSAGRNRLTGSPSPRTMGMVTLALFSLLFAIEVKDERQSAFSLDTFSDKAFNISTAASVVLLILSTSLGIFHTVLKTTRLDLWQWLICTAAACRSS